MNKSNRSSLLFVVLAIGFSYSYWGLFFLSDQELLPFDPSSDLMGALRGYGPSLAAIIAAAVVYGRNGLRELWMRVTMWRIPLWLLASAIVVPVLVNLVLLFLVHSAGVDLVLNLKSVSLPKLILIFFFFAIVDGPIGEEVGWRGFLLPRLLEKHGVIFASALIGVVWFVWHLPLYVATERFDITLDFLLSYLFNNVAFSFLHTWFFLRSGGSALLSIIFHTAGNYCVFLSITLFPEVEQWPFSQHLYAGILVVAAIFAGVSIWRNPGYREGKQNDCVANKVV